jgi:hypothetical protein
MPDKWYQPSTSDDAVGAIEDCRLIVSFLSDCVTQEDSSSFKLSKNGHAGLYYILSLMEGVMDDSVKRLMEGEKERGTS